MLVYKCPGLPPVRLEGTDMTIWQRWLRRPQRIWLRRALFQVHLWTGLALGLYIAMLSVTGSILVYRVELARTFGSPRPVYDRNRPTISLGALRASAERANPGFTVTEMGERVSPRDPVIGVTLTRGSEQRRHVLNPYTGEDVGEAFTEGEAWVQWLTNLHDDLLFEREGRWWNGALSLVVTVTVVTGAIVWWPGASRWRRSLQVKRGTGWKRVNWDLHSAGGAWLFLFLLMWGVSGFYLGIPEPFSDFVDAISDPEALERPGDLVLMWMTRLHFGRWRTVPWLMALWSALGLVPAVMFVTGVIMWWNRVLRRRPSREAESEEAVA